MCVLRKETQTTLYKIESNNRRLFILQKRGKYWENKANKNNLDLASSINSYLHLYIKYNSSKQNESKNKMREKINSMCLHFHPWPSNDNSSSIIGKFSTNGTQELG